MIEVSDSWKEVHKQMILPETFVEISMGIVDNDTKGVVSTTSEATFSNSSAIINQRNSAGTRPYALLEQNLWALDGSMQIVPDVESYRPPGYVSLDADSEITLSVGLKTPGLAIPGFTITWSNEYGTYATRFTVTVENQSTTLATTTVTDNTSNVSTLDMPVENYTAVHIVIHEWSAPEQRRRIDGVMLGQSIVFGKNDIVSFSHEQTGSPVGLELPKNAIEFSLDNSDGRWNILNPKGLGNFLYARQKVDVRYGMDIDGAVEWISAGAFYLSEWKAPPDGISATFVARDAFEFLLNSTYSRAGRNGVTTALTKVYASMEDVVENGSDGTNYIKTLATGTPVMVYEQGIDRSDAFSSPDAPNWKTCRIDQGWISAANVRITDETGLYQDVVGAGVTVRNGFPKIVYGTILSTYEGPIAVDETNAADFLLKVAATCAYGLWSRSDGAFRIYVPPTDLSDYLIPLEFSYQHPSVELAKPVRAVGVDMHDPFSSDVTTYGKTLNPDGIDQIVDTPFLWSSNTAMRNSVLDRYANWWKRREFVSGEFRADPRLELFDVVTVETKYGRISPIMITHLKYTYNGCFRASYEGKCVGDFTVEG